MITDKEIQILKEMHFHGEISESEFKRRMEQARTEEREARENFMKAIAGNKEAPKTMTEQEAKLILNVRVSRFDHANDVNEALEVAISALEEIKQYRELGTVEELRGAMEKQRAKKPYIEIEKSTELHEDYDCYECPNCDSFLGHVSDCKDENYRYDYCPNCGQAIDWEVADD